MKRIRLNGKQRDTLTNGLVTLRQAQATANRLEQDLALYIASLRDASRMEIPDDHTEWKLDLNKSTLTFEKPKDNEVTR